MTRFWIVALCIVMLAGPAGAQVSIRASVDSRQVYRDELINLTVEVTGATNVSQPKLGPLDGLRLVGTGRGTAFSFGTGGSSASATFTYYLKPTRSGKVKVPAATLSYGGKVLKTKPIEVTVLATTARPAPRPRSGFAPPWPSSPAPPLPETSEAEEAHLTLKASVDRTTAYVNQQVTYTLTLARSSELWQAQFDLPEFTGFRTEELPDVPVEVREQEGRRVAVQRERVALFPSTPGQKEIPAAKLVYMLSAFSPGVEQVKSEAIKLNVLPLPEANRPAGFSGAVGQWRAEAMLDRSEVGVGDAATLKVVVTGEGNVETVTPPEVRLPADIEQYKPQEERRSEAQGVKIKGRATFEYVLVPKRPGSHTVGPAELAYFDPVGQVYRLARTKPLQLTVTGTGVASGPIAGASRAAVQAGAEDIHHIKSSPGKSVLRLQSAGWMLSLLQIVPAAMALWVALSFRHQQRLREDGAYARRYGAARQARRRLAEARRQARDEAADGFYGAVSRAVQGYIADLLDLTKADLSGAEAATILTERGADPELAGAVRTLLEQCEQARFAPLGNSTAGREQVLDQARRLLDRLRRTLGP